MGRQIAFVFDLNRCIGCQWTPIPIDRAVHVDVGKV
jgi:Fe-S-cluster-containing dehydrogenase component